jgi:hypothetical protein
MSLFPVSRLLAALLLLGLIGAPAAQAQEDPVPEPSDPNETASDTLVGWEYDANARLNASQAAFKDWEEGSSNNSLAFTAALGGEANRRGERWIQSHQLQLAFGLIDQEGQEVRIAEDLIRWDSSVRYEGQGFFRRFNPTIAANLQTQFAIGFDYTSNPFEGEVENDPRLQLDPPVQTSRFFAPAFITESLGLTYEPFRDFTLRLGAASKQTVVTEEDFRVLYGVSEEDLARVEAGAEFASSFDRKITENIRYQSQLNAFLAVNQTEEPPDARWRNTVNLKVNDWLSTDLEFVALFDEDISDAIQLKETLSVGVSFTLL